MIEKTKTSGLLAILCLALGLTGCGPRTDDPATIRVWAHQGQEAENQAMRNIVAAFNEAHAGQGIRAHIDFFPDHQYADRVAAAAAADDLPDVMDLDGPTVARFVEAGLLEPLTPYFTPEELDDFLPTIIEQGTVEGTLYALGAFDSALALFYDTSMLERAGVAPPTADAPWSWDEFLQACARLKQTGIDPIALHMDESADEWYTYAFSPVIWSVGGSLIDTAANQAQGVLDAPRNIHAFQQWQRLFKKDYANPAPVDPNPFGSGQTAMDWTGHWMARSHIETKGENLGVAPLPLPGDQLVAACGSWCWALLAGARNKDNAALFLRWVLSTEHGVIPIVRANGAIPARLSAYPSFPEYESPPYSLFKHLLIHHGKPRPRTPRYAALTRHFAEAVREIARSGDVETALQRAAEQAQAAIRH